MHVVVDAHLEAPIARQDAGHLPISGMVSLLIKSGAAGRHISARSEVWELTAIVLYVVYFLIVLACCLLP